MSYNHDSCCACSCPCTNCCMTTSPLPSRPLGVTRKRTFHHKNDSNLIVQCLEWEPRPEASASSAAKSQPADPDADRFVTSSSAIGSFIDRSALPPPCTCRCDCGKKDKAKCGSGEEKCCNVNGDGHCIDDTVQQNGNGNGDNGVNATNGTNNAISAGTMVPEVSFTSRSSLDETKRSTRRPATASQADKPKPKQGRPRVADFRFYEANNQKQIHRRLKIDAFHRKRENARLSFTVAKAGGVSNTRDLPSTLVSNLSQKPPFHGYGEANTAPVFGGIIYGDYLRSHNVKPDILPNKPQHPQSTFAARYALEKKRQENLHALDQLKHKSNQYYSDQRQFPMESEFWCNEYEKPLFSQEIYGRSLWNLKIRNQGEESGSGTITPGTAAWDRENQRSDSNANSFILTADQFAALKRDLNISGQSHGSGSNKGRKEEFFVPMMENSTAIATGVKGGNKSFGASAASAAGGSVVQPKFESQSRVIAPVFDRQSGSKQFQATFAWQ